MFRESYEDKFRGELRRRGRDRYELRSYEIDSLRFRGTGDPEYDARKYARKKEDEEYWEKIRKEREEEEERQRQRRREEERQQEEWRRQREEEESESEE